MAGTPHNPPAPDQVEISSDFSTTRTNFWDPSKDDNKVQVRVNGQVQSVDQKMIFGAYPGTDAEAIKSRLAHGSVVVDGKNVDYFYLNSKNFSGGAQAAADAFQNGTVFGLKSRIDSWLDSTGWAETLGRYVQGEHKYSPKEQLAIYDDIKNKQEIAHPILTDIAQSAGSVVSTTAITAAGGGLVGAGARVLGIGGAAVDAGAGTSIAAATGERVVIQQGARLAENGVAQGAERGAATSIERGAVREGEQVAQSAAKPVEPVQAAKPVEPVQAAKPVEPVQAAKPVEPVQAAKPVEPAPAAKPVEPVQAAKPVEPVEAAKPVEPVQAAKPVEPAQGAKPVEPAKPNTAESGETAPETPADRARRLINQDRKTDGRPSLEQERAARAPESAETAPETQADRARRLINEDRKVSGRPSLEEESAARAPAGREAATAEESATLRAGPKEPPASGLSPRQVLAGTAAVATAGVVAAGLGELHSSVAGHGADHKSSHKPNGHRAGGLNHLRASSAQQSGAGHETTTDMLNGAALDAERQRNGLTAEGNLDKLHNKDQWGKQAAANIENTYGVPQTGESPATVAAGARNAPQQQSSQQQAYGQSRQPVIPLGTQATIGSGNHAVTGTLISGGGPGQARVFRFPRGTDFFAH